MRILKLTRIGILCFVILNITISVPAIAQTAPGLTAEEKAELTGTRKQLATIVFAGLAGAIMGLSTLSFYGRPQEHLNNIAIGGALGVIAGTIYTTYKAARNPYEAYDLGANEIQPLNFSAGQNQFNYFAENNMRPTNIAPVFRWGWTF